MSTCQGLRVPPHLRSARTVRLLPFADLLDSFCHRCIFLMEFLGRMELRACRGGVWQVFYSGLNHSTYD